MIRPDEQPQLANVPWTGTPVPVSDGWRVDRDIACPTCEYNLRGLLGPVLDCPECGRRVDVIELATRRWDKPWYRAPGYNFISLPAAWAMLSLVMLLCSGAFVAAQLRPGSMTGSALLITIAAWMIALLGWAGLLSLAYIRFGRDFAAVGFALLAHLALGGYLLGIGLIVGGIISGFTGLQDDEVLPLILGAAMLVGGVGLMVAGRFAERAAAKYCIRKWMKKGAGA